MKRFEKIVFFDVETTGLDPEKDQIIELGVMTLTADWEGQRKNFLCKLPEGERLPEEIVKLTGITEHELKRCGSSYLETCKQFHDIIQSDGEVLFISYGIQFDISFILEMFKRCGMSQHLPKMHVLDILTVYRDRVPKHHSLDDAIEHYRLFRHAINRHRAFADTTILFALTDAIKKERNDLEDYIDLIGYKPEYGITGKKLDQFTYMPQVYNKDCRLPDLKKRRDAQ